MGASKGTSKESGAARPDLLAAPLKVVNVGIEQFAQDLQSLDVAVVHVDWSPPAGGDEGLAALLAKLGA